MVTDNTHSSLVSIITNSSFDYLTTFHGIQIMRRKSCGRSNDSLENIKDIQTTHTFANFGWIPERQDPEHRCWMELEERDE